MRGRKRASNAKEDKKFERNSSLDSEEEKFREWQQQRENKLKSLKYVKNDKVYIDISKSTEENDKSMEKKKLKHFMNNYKNERLKGRKERRKCCVRSHLSEVNRSLTEMICSEKSNPNSKKDRSNSSRLNENISGKAETNFFDIFVAVSNNIIEDNKPRKVKKRRTKRKVRAHSNAFSESKF